MTFVPVVVTCSEVNNTVTTNAKTNTNTPTVKTNTKTAILKTNNNMSLSLQNETTIETLTKNEEQFITTTFFFMYSVPNVKC